MGRSPPANTAHGCEKRKKDGLNSGSSHGGISREEKKRSRGQGRAGQCCAGGHSMSSLKLPSRTATRKVWHHHRLALSEIRAPPLFSPSRPRQARTRSRLDRLEKDVSHVFFPLSRDAKRGRKELAEVNWTSCLRGTPSQLL